MTTDFHRLSTELYQAAKEIQIKDGLVEAARLVYLTAKADYERDKAKALIETKLRNPEMTQTDVNAESVVISYDSKITAVKAESAYKKLVGELKALRDKLTALQECSYNLRQEARLTSAIQQ